MRVGVITFHNAHNFGATLQALALQRVLKNLGCRPCIIHYHPNAIDNLYVPVPERGIKGVYKRIRLPFRKRARARLAKYRKYSSYIRNNFILLGDYKKSGEVTQEGLNLDAYITGSDQVWNPFHLGGYDPVYTLEFVKDARKIAYAASAGKVRIDEAYRDDFRRSLPRFDSISVREMSLRTEIEELSGLKVSITLDPTLLLDREEYEAYKVPTHFGEKYILVYMMEKNKKMVGLVNKISRITGYPVVQRKLPGVFKNECGSFYNHDPGEFLGDVEGAEFILTNSFHGTVFAIIYEKPFLSMLHSGTGSRIIDLLTELGLESHIIYDPDTFTELDRMEIKDIHKVKERIGELRQDSISFLKTSLFI